MAILREKVKPERDQNNRENYRKSWWQFAEYRPGLFEALATCDRCLVTSGIPKHRVFALATSRQVFSHNVYIFPLESMTSFAVLQSNVHLAWADLLCHLYVDTKGFVTVGIGNMLPNAKAAQALAFVNRATRNAATGRSPRTADSLLREHTKAGSILRLRRGLYAAIPPGTSVDGFQVDPFLIANKLAPDATAAYHAALQLRGKSYSVWHRFAVLTRAATRPLTFQGSEFTAVRPPRALAKLPDMGGGIVREPHAGGTVRATTLERTLVDVLDSPLLGGGWEEIWRSLEMVEYFDLDAVLSYTRILGSAVTAGRVGFFLEQHRDALSVEDRHLSALRELAPRQPSYLERRREPGRLVKSWNLVVPQRVLDRAWAEVA